MNAKEFMLRYRVADEKIKMLMRRLKGSSPPRSEGAHRETASHTGPEPATRSGGPQQRPRTCSSHWRRGK